MVVSVLGQSAALGPFPPTLAQPGAGLSFHAKKRCMAKPKRPPGEPMTLGNMFSF